MLVIEFNSAGNSLGQCESRGGGDDAAEFIPSLLGDMLGNQRVLGFDVGEFCHFDCKMSCKYYEMWIRLYFNVKTYFIGIMYKSIEITFYLQNVFSKLMFDVEHKLNDA